MLDKAILSGLAAKVILSGMAAKTILNGFAAKVILSGLGRSTFMRARTYTFNFLSFKATPKYAKGVICRLKLKKCTHALSHCHDPALFHSPFEYGGLRSCCFMTCVGPAGRSKGPYLASLEPFPLSVVFRRRWRWPSRYLSMLYWSTIASHV